MSGCFQTVAVLKNQLNNHISWLVHLACIIAVLLSDCILHELKWVASMYVGLVLVEAYSYLENFGKEQNFFLLILFGFVWVLGIYFDLSLS